MHLNIHHLIDKAILEEAEQEPRREYIGASIIAGECERRIWYGFRWWTPETFPARIHRRFETGHLMEERVISWLRKAGWEVRDKNPNARNGKGQYRARVLHGVLSGGVDGFVRHPDLMPDWGLLEVKAVVSGKYDTDDDGEPCRNRTDLKEYRSGGSTLEGTWWRLKRLGVQKMKPEHFGQMQTYMGLSHATRDDGKPWHEAWDLPAPLTRALYVAVNTDTDQIYDEVIGFDPKWYKAALKRADRVARSSTPPDRVQDVPKGFPCEWCNLVDHCHGSATPAPNCRNCTHSRLKIPGDAGYHGSVLAWLCDKHRRGCGDYTACDQWQAIDTTEMF